MQSHTHSTWSIVMLQSLEHSASETRTHQHHLCWHHSPVPSLIVPGHQHSMIASCSITLAPASSSSVSHQFRTLNGKRFFSKLYFEKMRLAGSSKLLRQHCTTALAHHLGSNQLQFCFQQEFPLLSTLLLHTLVCPVLSLSVRNARINYLSSQMFVYLSAYLPALLVHFSLSVDIKAQQLVASKKEEITGK